MKYYVKEAEARHKYDPEWAAGFYRIGKAPPSVSEVAASKPDLTAAGNLKAAHIGRLFDLLEKVVAPEETKHMIATQIFKITQDPFRELDAGFLSEVRIQEKILLSMIQRPAALNILDTIVNAATAPTPVTPEDPAETQSVATSSAGRSDWADFWQRVNGVIGKSHKPKVAMKFASFLKEQKHYNSWTDDEIRSKFPVFQVIPVEETPKEEKVKEEKPKKGKKAKEEPVGAVAAAAPAPVVPVTVAPAPAAPAPAPKKSKKKELPPLPASEPSSANNSPPLPPQPPVPTSLAPAAPTPTPAPAAAPAPEAAEEEKSKKKIPKKVKDDVWKTYIGEEIAKHKCLCCKMTTIDKAGFDCGHVVSEANGGGLEIKNLRPICAGCNHSMGTTNMVDYVKKHGYFIGGGM
jgi:hypothetical protein